MADAEWVRQQAALSLERLWPRIEARFQSGQAAAPDDWRAFEVRVRREWERRNPNAPWDRARQRIHETWEEATT